MRIGIMLRSLEEKGGVGIYTRYLLQELLDRDRRNEYVLFYTNPARLGSYGHLSNVSERIVQVTNKAFWDQVSIPYACLKARVDVVLHPKFTAPLLAPCKTVMTLHGADWFIPDHARFYSRWDVWYMRLMTPLYLRKCAAVLSVSQITTSEFERIFDVPSGKIRTTYFGPARHFRRVEDEDALAKVREKYDLPRQFILTLSGYDRGKRKNIDRILEAYRLYHGRTPHALVVGGKDCDRFKADYGIPDEGYGRDIRFPGWLEQEDLPAIYSMASLYLYPSNVEAFPIPLTEAMACGTPIVTSSVNGLKEIAGEAACFVDASDPRSIADGIEQVLTHPETAAALRSKALDRARLFSWQRCADETLQTLESLHTTPAGWPRIIKARSWRDGPHHR